MVKYIFVTGGVTSSLGKGIISASLAKLLQARGLRVTIQKFDPYINIDPGTMSPIEHGEVFVTDDGAETDLDLGHYERFLSKPTSRANNVTTGKIYQTVMDAERAGKYLGKTVQVIPHITNEIMDRFERLSNEKNFDIIITEIGGTVGDIESLPYLEAIRQFRWRVGRDNFLVIHLTLVPYLSKAGELKTKPTQHSVKALSTLGVQPDVLVCRTEHPLNMEIRRKLSLFCNVELNSVIESIDADSIYDVPLMMLKEKLDQVVMSKLRLPDKREPNLENWKNFLGKLKNPTDEVQIGLIGKYNKLKDAYLSIYESFVHAGAVNECKVKVIPIEAEELEGDHKKLHSLLSGLDGILVAPGFGDRGTEGKINAIQFVRENGIPFFGICLGMQTAMVEFARNVLGYKDAASTEWNPKTSHPIIHLMEGQKKVKNKGGTMRLGSYSCTLRKRTKVYNAYRKVDIKERHRHRFEFNNDFRNAFEAAGMIPTGIHEEKDLVEVMEYNDHPWFMGVQYHPEYKSTVEHPHPLFVSFVKACLAYNTSNE